MRRSKRTSPWMVIDKAEKIYKDAEKVRRSSKSEDQIMRRKVMANPWRFHWRTQQKFLPWPICL